MHILYVDDSGHVENPTERYFVLGGISVFERGIFHAIKAADECVAQFGLGQADEIELHGSPMYSGRSGVWSTVRERPKREQMIKQALASFQSAASVRLFAVAVDKASVDPEDPVLLRLRKYATALTCSCSGTTTERAKASAG